MTDNNMLHDWLRYFLAPAEMSAEPKTTTCCYTLMSGSHRRFPYLRLWSDARCNGEQSVMAPPGDVKQKIKHVDGEDLCMLMQPFLLIFFPDQCRVSCYVSPAEGAVCVSACVHLHAQRFYFIVNIKTCCMPLKH